MACIPVCVTTTKSIRSSKLNKCKHALSQHAQYVAWAVNGTSQYVDSLNNYQAKGDGIWFSFEKRVAPGSLTVANGDQVAIK